MSTVHQLFVLTAARRPDSEFLFIDAVTASVYGIPSDHITWAAAAQEVKRLQMAYARAGYGHGHRVGLRLDNRPGFLFHWFALNALGVSVVPINSEMRSAELEYLLGHSGIQLAVVLPGFTEDVKAAADSAKSGTLVWDGTEIGAMPAATAPPPQQGVPPGIFSECALLYTSGTTGRPKGCQLSNQYFLRSGEWYAGLDGLCSVGQDTERIITPLPLNHVNAMAFSTMVILTAGGCLIQLDRFHPKSWWSSVRNSKATIIHYLGVMPAMLLSATDSDRDRAHDVRWAFGAGVDKKNHDVFEKRFGFPLVEAWAMTETGAAACIMANREPRHVGTSCFGKPEAFVEVRLVDDEGQDVPDGTPGELLVRSSGADPRRNFFSGYLKDDQATTQAWEGGWFHTGDVVKRDPQGHMFFVDRKKNVIRRSGENISAVEVESILNQHPLVRTSAVAATPDEVRGDEVLVCVITRERLDPSRYAEVAASIVHHALAQLAYYKAPGYVAFVNELPLTSSQKIQRGHLRDFARTLPDQANCIDTRAMKKRQS